MLFLLGRRMGGSKKIATLIAAGFATGCSPWIFGSVAEVVAPSSAAFLFMMLRTLYRKSENPLTIWETWFLGWVFGLAVTWSHILFIYLPVIWIFLVIAGKPKPIRFITGFTIAAAIWLIASYGTVVFIFLKATSLEQFWEFLTYYARIGLGGREIGLRNPVAALRTLLLTQSYSYLRPETLFADIGAALATIGALAVAILGLAGWVWGRLIVPRERAGILVFALISLGFIIWWFPSAWDYWVLPWAILLLGITRIRLKRQTLTALLLGFIFTAIALYNLITLVLPRLHDEDNPYYNLCQSIKQYTLDIQSELFTTDMHLWVTARYWAHISAAFHYIETAPNILPEKKQSEFITHLTGLRLKKTPQYLIVDGDVLNATRNYWKDSADADMELLDSAWLLNSQYYDGKLIQVYLIKQE
jgi:hypothetical protein